MSTLAATLRKSRTVFAVQLQDGLAYRSQAFIWILTSVVPAMLMPLLWLASYNGRTTIGGLTPSDMVAYYLATLTLSNLMVTHIMWDMSNEIREGRFSIYLTRPFSYMTYQFLGNLSWRVMRLVLFLPVIPLYALIFGEHLRWEGYNVGPAFWAAIALGHLLSFCMSYMFGLLALFFTEVRGIYMVYYMPASFLSGEMVPLSTLPGWAEVAARLLPFRYSLAFPVEILLNRLPAEEIGWGFVCLTAWLMLGWVGTRTLWNAGLKHYTGTGM